MIPQKQFSCAVTYGYYNLNANTPVETDCPLNRNIFSRIFFTQVFLLELPK